MNSKINKTINRSITALAFISLMLGTGGWFTYYPQIGKEIDLWTALYKGIQLFAMESDFETMHLPLALSIARFSAPLSLASAVIIGFLMLTRNGYSNFRIKHAFRKHVIICGYTKRARILIEDLLTNHKKLGIVVIDEHPEHLGEIQGNSLIFLEGNAASVKILKRAGIKKAAYVLLLDDDSNDLRTLDQLKKMNFQGKIILHLTDPHTTMLYKEMSKELGLADLHVISDARLLAGRIVDQYSPDQFKIIKSTDDPQAHILLCGDDPILFHLLREMGIMYHFANLKKPNITIAVPDPEAFRAQLFSFQLSHLDEAVDYSIIELKELANLKNSLDEAKTISISMICCKEFAQSMELGRRLRQNFFSQNRGINDPFILVIESLSENQPNVDNELLKKMEKINLSFCDSSRQFSTETVIRNIEKYDIIAKFIHNSFSLRESTDYTNAEEMWSQLSDAEKDWNRWPARHFQIKLRAVGAKIVNENEPGDEFDIESVTEDKRFLLARMEKKRWNAEKWLTGFVPGEYQDDKVLEKALKKEFKLHPALISWEEISPEEQRKDSYAFNNIREILKKAGLKIIVER